MKTTKWILGTILFLSLILTFGFGWKSGLISDIWYHYLFLAVLELVAFLANFFICEFFSVYDFSRKLKGFTIATSAILCFLIIINYLVWFPRYQTANIEANNVFWEVALHKNPFQYQAIKAVGLKQQNLNDYKLIMIEEEPKDTIKNKDSIKCRQETQLYNLGEVESTQNMHFNRQLVYSDSTIEELFDISVSYAMAHPEIPLYARLLTHYKSEIAAVQEIKNGDTTSALKHLNDAK